MNRLLHSMLPGFSSACYRRFAISTNCLPTAHLPTIFSARRGANPSYQAFFQIPPDLLLQKFSAHRIRLLAIAIQRLFSRATCSATTRRSCADTWIKYANLCCVLCFRRITLILSISLKFTYYADSVSPSRLPYDAQIPNTKETEKKQTLRILIDKLA